MWLVRGKKRFDKIFNYEFALPPRKFLENRKISIKQKKFGTLFADETFSSNCVPA